MEDLKNFFLRWYGPNNATLTVGGDVKPAEVVKLAEKYFGSIKRGPAVPVQKLPAPVLTADRYVSYQDNVRFPMLQMVFPTVPHGHPDDLALDALADIMGGGKTSLLYKNLVKNQKTVQAQAYQQNSELGGCFDFMALPFPGKGLDSTEAIVRNTMKEFEKTRRDRRGRAALQGPDRSPDDQRPGQRERQSEPAGRQPDLLQQPQLPHRREQGAARP